MNNAAYETYVQLAEAEMELVEDILRVNLVPVMLKALIPNLQGRGPIGDQRHQHPRQRCRGQQRALRHGQGRLADVHPQRGHRVAKLGIRVNALAPGAIETDMNRETINKLGREKFNAWIPAGRVGTCDELVAPFIFWRVVGLGTRQVQGFAWIGLMSTIPSATAPR